MLPFPFYQMNYSYIAKYHHLSRALHIKLKEKPMTEVRNTRFI